MKVTRLIAALAAALSSGTVDAVRLNPDGTGQALIYPYYTARTGDGAAFNTYISVANETSRAKAVRVHVRESRLGRVVTSLNVFLAPNDLWTGAIVPTAEGARIVTSDVSCTDPPPADPTARAFDFHDRNYPGPNSAGAGTGLDRTREGYVEMLELGTLTGLSAAAVTHTGSTQIPANCAAVFSLPLQIEAPTGGLSGTLTLIDVARGMDFTLNAEALDELASQPYYRPASDPYPGFDAAEIDPVSVVTANGAVYRSTWPRGLDAVTAALMRKPSFEYTLDAATRSGTDFVITMPTKPFHVRAFPVAPPFSADGRWHPTCQSGTVDSVFGEHVSFYSFSREERVTSPDVCGLSGPASCSFSMCGVSSVGRMIGPVVLNSTSGGFRASIPGHLPPAGGWATMDAPGSATLTSLPTSTRRDLTTGAATGGAHTFRGLPVVGLWVRTFMNGTLDCGGAACQGNFGGAFPFRYTRSISP